MGLGLIALGFIFLEGIRVAFNYFQVIPQYISLTIILIGLLCIYKRIKIPMFIYVFIADIILILDYFLLIWINMPAWFYPIRFFGYLLFYIMLFIYIYQLTLDHKIKRYEIIFIVTYIVFYPLRWIETPIPGWVLLIILTIPTYLVAYQWYKKNKELSDIYHDTYIEFQHQFSIIQLFFICLSCLIVIVFLENPIMQRIKEDKVIEKRWYGEIENEVIVDNFWITRTTHFQYATTERTAPFIYIDKDIFEQSQYYRVTLSFDDHIINCTNQYEDIYKEDLSDNYFYGKRDDMQYLGVFINDLKIKDDILLNVDTMTMIIQLYDSHKGLVKTYDVLLQQELPFVEYEYQDQEVTINNLQIQDGFVMSTPDITINSQLNIDDVYISNKPSLNHGIFLSYDINKNQSEFEGKFTHVYIGELQEYYIHFVQYQNDQPQIIKTVRLMKK